MIENDGIGGGVRMEMREGGCECDNERRWWGREQAKSSKAKQGKGKAKRGRAMTGKDRRASESRISEGERRQVDLQNGARVPVSDVEKREKLSESQIESCSFYFRTDTRCRLAAGDT